MLHSKKAVCALRVALRLGLALLVLFVAPLTKAQAAAPTISYRAHVQTYDWMSWKKNGAMAGTTGQGKRLEALQIKVSSDISGSVNYRVHSQTYGWSDWKSAGKTAGTTGQAKRAEAVQIKLTGNLSNKYDVYYRVHVSKGGWLGWAKNGAVAGTTGMAISIEAIEIKLVAKSSSNKPNSTIPAQLLKRSLKVQAHVQTYGWLSATGEGSVVGTTGQGKRLEGIKLALPDLDGKGNVIMIRAHVSKDGWQSWRKNGAMAGTDGQAKAIEAVQIELDPNSYYGKIFDVYYCMHVQTYGWLGWAKNGEIAGTTAGGKRSEAIQIRLVPKNQSMPTGGAAYLDLTAVHLQHHMNRSLCQHDYGKAFSSYGCCAMSYAVGLSIVTGTDVEPTQFLYADSSGALPYCHYDMGHMGEYYAFDTGIICSQLMAGKATLVHYKWNTGEHWVCVVGIRQGANRNALTAGDLLVIDPGSGTEKILTDCGSFGISNSIDMRTMY